MLALKIDGKLVENEYVLDLNTNSGDTFDFEVVSTRDDDGFNVRWGVVDNSDLDNISTEYLIFENLRVIISLEDMKEKRFITLQNANDDFFTLTFLPNEEKSRVKVYTFKVGKHTFTDNVHTFNIISKETKYKLDWEITYEGAPLPIKAHKSQNKLIVEVLEPIMANYLSGVGLTQEESGNELKIHFHNLNDGTLEYVKE